MSVGNPQRIPGCFLGICNVSVLFREAKSISFERRDGSLCVTFMVDGASIMSEKVAKGEYCVAGSCEAKR